MFPIGSATHFGVSQRHRKAHWNAFRLFVEMKACPIINGRHIRELQASTWNSIIFCLASVESTKFLIKQRSVFNNRNEKKRYLRNYNLFFFTNLMHKFFILIHLLHSFTCFEHYCAHLQEDNCISTASGIVTFFVWLFITQITGRLCTEHVPNSHPKRVTIPGAVLTL